VSVSAGSDVAGPGSGVQAGVRVGAVGVCVCERPEGVRESASKAWPRCERDVAATSWSRRTRRGRGEAWAVWAWGTHARGSWFPRAAAWPCRARSTGIPGPWPDAAARRRRLLRERRLRDESLHKKVARWPEGELELVVWPHLPDESIPTAGLQMAHRRR
jgi:hypothetical protein